MKFKNVPIQYGRIRMKQTKFINIDEVSTFVSLLVRHRLARQHYPLFLSQNVSGRQEQKRIV